MPEQWPSKSRRALDTPAREVKGGTEETFLQVFNRFRKARTQAKLEEGGPTPVKVKIKRLEANVQNIFEQV